MKSRITSASRFASLCRSGLYVSGAALALAGCTLDRANNLPPGSPPGVLGVQRWQGPLHCDPVPGATMQVPDQPFTVTVTGNQAHYERPLFAPTGAQTGVIETGGGVVQNNGAVTLTGTAQGDGFSMTANYQGSMPPGGRSGALTGVQEWRGSAIPSFSRSCSVNLLGGAPGTT